MASKIIDGLASAVRYASGDKTDGRSFQVMTKRIRRRDPNAKSTQYLLYRAHQQMEAIWASVVGDKLTPRQFHLLSAIKRLGASSQRALVRETGVDRSTLSDMVRRLRERGLLTISADDGDKRVRVIDLTTSAKRLLRTVEPLAENVDAFVEHQLSRGDLGVMHDGLQKIIVIAVQPDAA